MPDNDGVMLERIELVEKPVQTRQSLLAELTLVYKQMSVMRPPRAVGGEITIGQMRNWQCKLDWCKARVYALTSMYPVLREEEMKVLEAQVREIQEMIENGQ